MPVKRGRRYNPCLDLRISPRERLVLTSIIENYIATGEPVASQVIARQFGNKDGMSSATIRNVMASLGDAGLLDQPAYFRGTYPHGASLPVLRRTIIRTGKTGSADAGASRSDRRQLPGHPFERAVFWSGRTCAVH